MNQTVMALIQQILMMFLLAAMGYLMFRKKKIDMAGNQTLANILIYLSLPCVIINGFLVERSAENVEALLVSAAASALILAVAMVIAALFFKKDDIARFSATFSNPGFFGVPIIISLLGKQAVFNIAMFIAMLNLLQWTYGVSLLKGSKEKLTVSKLIHAPFMIALIIGLILFVTQVQLPSVILKSIDYVAGVNTPIAMFTIGVYFAHVDVKKMFQKKQLFLVSLVRQVIIPLVSIFVLMLVPANLSAVRLAVLIAAGCPVGSNVAVYAQLHNRDYSYAVETVIVSSLLSIISLPLIVSIAMRIW